MSTRPKSHLGLLILALGCLARPLSATLVEIREYHGKQVSCVHSGLVGSGCGTEWYARVFTGTVAFSFESGDTDKVLQLLPDEVFFGDFSSATVITNQACLNSEIRAGEKWLFYLSRDPKTDGLVLSYNSPSKPISEAEDDISMLRDLGHLKNTGILNFCSMEGSVSVENRRCWERDFGVKLDTGPVVQTDGIISGHIGSPDGKPFTVHPWVQVVSVDSDFFRSAYVDSKGYFEANGVKPGRYMVGLGIRRGTGYFSDVPTPVYYPGVRTKEQATIIELRPGEKHTDVDFQLPIEDVLKPLRPATSDR